MRIRFEKGEQKIFLNRALQASRLNIEDFSRDIGIHKRTFFDWRREKNLMSLSALQSIQKLIDIPLPKKVSYVEDYWYAAIAGKLGAQSLIKKYGKPVINEDIRKSRWIQWWLNEGIHKRNVILQPKNVRIPRKSVKLAEFFGIMIGDGGMTRYFLSVTVSYKVDREYAVFIEKFMRLLFEVSPKVYTVKNSYITLTLSRKKVVDYLQSIGLKIGNKLLQGLDIPPWIMENASYKVACIRGLFDTDGCVYREVHRYKQKEYAYIRLTITSYSVALRKSIVSILSECKIKSNIRGRNVVIEEKKGVESFFKVIGSHNAKHLGRFNEFGGVA